MDARRSPRQLRDLHARRQGGARPSGHSGRKRGRARGPRQPPCASRRRHHGAEGRVVLLRQERQILDHRPAGHRLGIVPHAGLGAHVRAGQALALRRSEKRRQGSVLRSSDGGMNVLFLCTGNSARSILAEAYLNSAGRGRFTAYSAGSHPAGKVNPFALQLLEKNRLPTKGLRSKNWDEFAAQGAPPLDFVFTVCDAAAGEVCPVWPGRPITAHWGIADPAAVVGTDEDKRKAFLRAFTELSTRINLMLALPVDKLDRLTLRNKLDEIGKIGKKAPAR